MCEKINYPLSNITLIDSMDTDSSDDDCECVVYCTGCGMDMATDDVHLWIHETDDAYCYCCYKNLVEMRT